jgi:hypothetical protein
MSRALIHGRWLGSDVSASASAHRCCTLGSGQAAQSWLIGDTGEQRSSHCQPQQFVRNIDATRWPYRRASAEMGGQFRAEEQRNSRKGWGAFAVQGGRRGAWSGYCVGA